MNCTKNAKVEYRVLFELKKIMQCPVFHNLTFCRFIPVVFRWCESDDQQRSEQPFSGLSYAQFVFNFARLPIRRDIRWDSAIWPARSKNKTALN